MVLLRHYLKLVTIFGLLCSMFICYQSNGEDNVPGDDIYWTDRKETVVDLYITGIDFNAGEKPSKVDFLYLPSELAAECQGKAYVECLKIDQVHYEKQKDKSKEKLPEIPDRMMVFHCRQSEYYSQDQKILDHINKLPFYKSIPKKAFISFPVSGDKKVRAKIERLLWPQYHDESFTIIEILPEAKS